MLERMCVACTMLQFDLQVMKQIKPNSWKPEMTENSNLLKYGKIQTKNIFIVNKWKQQHWYTLHMSYIAFDLSVHFEIYKS